MIRIKVHSFLSLGLIVITLLLTSNIEIDQYNTDFIPDVINALNEEDNIFDSPKNSGTNNLFVSNESIQRNYNINYNQNSNIYFETPSEYDFGIFNLSLGVKSLTLNESIIEATYNTGIKTSEVAQSFNISNECILDSLSLYFGPEAKTDLKPTLQIKNNPQDEDFIYSSIITTYSGWVQINFSTPLVLSNGTYYVCLTPLSASGYLWYRSALGSTANDTWYNSGGGWIQANYNMTLKVYTRANLTPESVNLTINNQTVINTDNNRGSVNLSSSLNHTSNITFNVNSSIPVKIDYSGNASFTRTANHSMQLNYTQSKILGNITLNLAEWGTPYDEYKINLTGFQEDYKTITPMKGEDVIGFVKLSSTTIQMVTAPNYLTFESPNYMQSITAPDFGYSGDAIIFNFTLNNSGEVKIEIWNNATLINNTQKMYNINDSFTWIIDPTYPAGEYWAKFYYLSETHLGYIEHPFSVMKESILVIDSYLVDALDKISIECYYQDKYLSQNISDAQLSFKLNDIQGDLVSSTHGGYSSFIDFNQFALKPGSYQMEIVAEKVGYRSISKEIPVVIQSRNISLSLSQTRFSLQPQQSFLLQLALNDQKTNSTLLRPIDMKVSIVGINSNQSQYEVVNSWVYSCVRNCEVQFTIPAELEQGEYDILIEVMSDYYSGLYRYENAVKVSPPEESNTLMILLILLGASIAGISVLITIKIQSTKNSLGGILIIHENGTPMADLISEHFAKGDPILISGAVMGMITLIKEITGKGLHNLHVEGAYVYLAKKDNYWIVFFVQHNPFWIQKHISYLIQDIEIQYGQKIREFTGETSEFNLNPFVEKYFGKNNHLIQNIKHIEESKEKFFAESDISNKMQQEIKTKTEEDK